MQILSLNFFIYTVGGVWRPVEWSSSGSKFLYNFFTLVTVIPLYFLMLTQFMDIVLIVDNMDDFATNSLMFMTIVGVCCKATIAVIRRNAIVDLVQMLLKDPCRPRDEAYRVWLPYDSNESLMFWITSIHQIVSLIFATIINVGTETLIFGLFLQTCAQLEIFECRLHRLVTSKAAQYRQHFSSAAQSKEEALLSEYINHHLNIYKYAKMLNNVFNQVLFFQFFGSILVLCTSVYYMSTHITGSEAATLPAYTICMFVQIFVYCWSGNEVILKSMSISSAVYNMDWPMLSVNEKRDLLMIMKRSTTPIKFTSSFLITFSLESYSNILKTSYSAFNVLQRS